MQRHATSGFPLTWKIQGENWWSGKSLALDAVVGLSHSAIDPPYRTTLATKWHFDNNVFNNTWNMIIFWVQTGLWHSLFHNVSIYLKRFIPQLFSHPPSPHIASTWSQKWPPLLSNSMRVTTKWFPDNSGGHNFNNFVCALHFNIFVPEHFAS